MRVSPAGFAYMAEQMCSLAAGKVLVAVEGGYDLRSLSRSVCAVMRVLLGERAPPLAAAEPHMAAKLDVDAALCCQAPYWRCAKQLQSCVPCAVPRQQDDDASEEGTEQRKQDAQMSRARLKAQPEAPERAGGVRLAAAGALRTSAAGRRKQQARLRRRRGPAAWWWRRTGVLGLRLL